MVEQFAKVSDVKYALYILERSCQQLGSFIFEDQEHQSRTKNLLLEKMFTVCLASPEQEREQGTQIMFKCCLEMSGSLRAKYSKQFIDFVISH